jgi:hypothetical protein
MHATKLFLIAMALLMTGCAATVQRQGGADTKLAITAAATKRIVLVVQGSKSAAESTDWETLRTQWRSAMSEATAAAGLALVNQESVAPLPADAATLVVVTVQGFRYVSQGARIAGGVMTGNAFINTEVSFAELPANTPAGTRQYSAKSSAGQGLFAAMTGKQVRGICDEIVKEVISQR